jgi:hypothetical protein
MAEEWVCEAAHLGWEPRRHDKAFLFVMDYPNRQQIKP